MIKKFCKSFLVFVFLFGFLAPQNSFADVEGGIGRTRTCSASSGEVEGMEFNPTSGGKDVQFELTNPSCYIPGVVEYASVKSAIASMNSSCGNSGAVRVTPSPLMDTIDISKASAKCATGNQACCGGVALVTGVFGAYLSHLAAVFAIAKDTFNNTKVCGADWMKPNVNSYDFSSADYKQVVQNKINGYIRDKNYTENGLNPANKYYREWFYDGKEFEDNPYQGSVCLDPTQSKDSSGNYPRQKYYLKGTETGNYNCKKFLVLSSQALYDAEDMKKAYECCVNRSQNYMCLDYTNVNLASTVRTPTFCKKGETCTMINPDRGVTNSSPDNKVMNGSIWFMINQSKDSLLCAQSYSLCPYNFNVGGGSDYCDYYRDGKWSSSENRWNIITQEQIDAGDCAGNSEIRNEDCTYKENAGKCRNYCQYLTHCTKPSTESFIYRSSLRSPYFSQACLDFIGDSQNNTGFNSGVIMGKQMHFTAPIAQCVKETLENLFYNRAGHSSCLSSEEYPDSSGVCASGLYATNGNSDIGFQFIYKKGNQVKENSFFQVISNTMSLVIKMAITLAIVFYGANLLLLKANLGDKKSILVFILKIALVMYFCIGTAWQDVFFRGFYDASMSLANILFKVQTMQNPLQQDGCQFGTVVLKDGTQRVFSTYPDGKSYLAIWDTIDCKMMRYLGFGPQLTNANIASMVISTYFFGPIGIYFAVSVTIFGFFLVSLGIRALHIFISSAAAIILLIFISPMIIPCGMFERTKGIFNGWMGKLIAYCLQPMILFAYVAIFVTVMDQTLIGSATFHGNPPTKTMSCEKTCVDADGDLIPYDGDQAPACDQPGQEIVDPLDDSVACLLNFQNFGTWKAFQVVGVAVPMVKNLLESNVKERILTILKGALMMYLLYKFMDEIPGIIEALIGGSLAQKRANAFDMMTKARAATIGISERLAKAGSGVVKGTLSTIRDQTSQLGSKGKNQAEVRGRGSDHTSNDDGNGRGDHVGGDRGLGDSTSKGSIGPSDSTQDK
ncbi:MAG: type IV secretion system protein [Proteobacteria bacterium]|nr:type IV secretion system protein [Pseudomonadota bacterium]